MKKPLLLIAALLLTGLLFGCFYIVQPAEQVIITSFGKMVGDPVDEPGIHFKIPFIQDVNRLERRVLEWDGVPQRMPTKDKVYLEIDTFARWRIKDPVKFFVRLRDERTAQSRLDTMLGGATQGELARHELVELIRTDKDRKSPVIAPAAEGTVPVGNSTLPPIRSGRQEVAVAIVRATAPRLLEDFGIELLDLQFKRLNYSKEVQEKIHSRMSSERAQIAERFRSEGQGEALTIDGERERELKRIQSEAYRKVQEITGKADAEATRVYAEAYNSSPVAADFYNFTRTLETYGNIVDQNTTVVLSTDSDLYRLMKALPPLPAALKAGNPSATPPSTAAEPAPGAPN